jgi:DnaA-homolog protein
MKQIPLAIGPEPARTFENFLPGANGEALAHLAALAPGAPPVYLWGPAGSGKTHLLHALVERAAGHGQQAAWFSSATPAPWTTTGERDWLVIDDAHALDAAQQQAAFALFVDATTRGAGVIAAGSVPPVDLDVREDLRTRLGWGHVFAIQPLSDAEARAALRREADRRGLFLSDDVMDYLLTRFARDLKHLNRMLDALDAYALLHKRAPTLPLLRQMLADDDA